MPNGAHVLVIGAGGFGFAYRTVVVDLEAKERDIEISAFSEPVGA